jgi:hypothetical protein
MRQSSSHKPGTLSQQLNQAHINSADKIYEHERKDSTGFYGQQLHEHISTNASKANPYPNKAYYKLSQNQPSAQKPQLSNNLNV